MRPLSRRLAIAVFAIVLGVLPVRQAGAWGYEGHRIVAEIAEHYLAPGTARKVHGLLALENITLADASTWADEIRTQRPETARWHYVDIPIHPPTGTPARYDPGRDCPHNDCVVARIGIFRTVLRDTREPPRKRLEALKFLVHFVGDIHQPLHCSNDNDRGGNDIHVTLNGTTTNLHAVWDTGFIETAMQGDEREYAKRLLRSISPGEVAHWRRGSPVDWANESYRIAARVIYKRLPPTTGALPKSYESWALPIVNEQLEKAGVRLAMILDQTLSANHWPGTRPR